MKVLLLFLGLVSSCLVHALAATSEQELMRSIADYTKQAGEDAWFEDFEIEPEVYSSLIRQPSWRAVPGRIGVYYRQSTKYTFLLIPERHIARISPYDIAPPLAAAQEASERQGIIFRLVHRDMDQQKDLSPRERLITATQEKDPAERANLPPTRTATAFMVTENLAITNAHAVSQADLVEVMLGENWTQVEVVKEDGLRDLALLRLPVSRKTYLRLADGTPTLGESVFTVGFPNSELQGISPKYTRGEISSLSGLQDNPLFYQISVPIQPGNSGGPLVDESSGEVVGVVTARLNDLAAIRQTGVVPQNVNYALKASVLQDFLRGAGVSLRRSAFRQRADAQSAVESVVLVRSQLKGEDS